MIIVEDVSKSFRGAGRVVEALKSLSFKIGPGEVWGVVGANGAGKTTLLRVLAAQLTADSGEVWVAGYDVRRQGRAVKNCLGFVHADASGFYARLSARENLEFFGALYGVSSSSLKRRLEDLARLLEIQNFLARPVQELSSGTIQRLSLARALLKDPPVVLIDELSRSVDPGSAKALWDLVQSTLKGKTILVASHSREEVEALCQKILVLSQGKILAQGSLPEIYRNLGVKSFADLYGRG